MEIDFQIDQFAGTNSENPAVNHDTAFAEGFLNGGRFDQVTSVARVKAIPISRNAFVMIV
ncbi:hypothetical protein GCM10028805_57720 [Spirosoma harenae]